MVQHVQEDEPRAKELGLRKLAERGTESWLPFISFPVSTHLGDEVSAKYAQVVKKVFGLRATRDRTLV